MEKAYPVTALLCNTLVVAGLIPVLVVLFLRWVEDLELFPECALAWRGFILYFWIFALLLAAGSAFTVWQMIQEQDRRL